jgi:hypothetical protein
MQTLLLALPFALSTSLHYAQFSVFFHLFELPHHTVLLSIDPHCSSQRSDPDGQLYTLDVGLYSYSIAQRYQHFLRLHESHFHHISPI